MITQAINVFCCYAHQDQALLNTLTTHLKPLEREGLITVWADIYINAGTEWQPEIEKRLNAAQIILLLVSPDFMNSEYCYSVEMKSALARHHRNDACVIPLILRPVTWQGAPFGKLQVLPPKGKPVISRDWHNQDEAFFYTVEGIRRIAESILATTKRTPGSLPQNISERRQQLKMPTFSANSQQIQAYSPSPGIKFAEIIDSQEVLSYISQKNIPPHWKLFRTSIFPLTLGIFLLVGILFAFIVAFFANASNSGLYGSWIAFISGVLMVSGTIYIRRIPRRKDLLVLLPQGFVYRRQSKVYTIHFNQVISISKFHSIPGTGGFLVQYADKNTNNPKGVFLFGRKETTKMFSEVIAVYHQFLRSDPL